MHLSVIRFCIANNNFRLTNHLFCINLSTYCLIILYSNMIVNILSSRGHKARVTPDIQQKLDDLEKFKQNHSFWDNKLLKACKEGTITFSHWQYIFGQYYLYNRNFTRYLSAVMANCDNDYYRAELSENLWEEAGNMEELGNKNEDQTLRHAELFRKFLTDCLNIDVSNIEYQDFSKRFAEQYLHLSIENDAMYGSAFLSYGTEGIVADLYTRLVEGMVKSGIKKEDLKFFLLHMECDDEHALTLAEMTASYADHPYWFETCIRATDEALNLRKDFFNNLYETLWLKPVSDNLAEGLLNRESLYNQDGVYSIHESEGEQLYKNKEGDINFDVVRLNVSSTALDPRINIIKKGCTTESHSHGHETVIYILEGNGEFIVDGNKFSFKPGQCVFVPRYSEHQTIANGNSDVKFLAVTDYKLATSFLGNFESTYRQNKKAAESISADKKLHKVA